MPDYTYVKPFNQKLTTAEREQNARYIANTMMYTHSMTLESVCGMLGNWEAESTLNPNIVETSQASRWPNWGNYGFGIAQWTPWYTRMNTAGKWIDPANYHGTGKPTYGYWAEQRGFTPDATTGGTIGNMEPQLEYMAAGEGGWANSTSWYKMTWKEYCASTWAPSELAKVYYRNYERSDAGAEGNRPTLATKWYDFLKGEFPPGPGPEPSDSGKFKWWIYLPRRRW